MEGNFAADRGIADASRGVICENRRSDRHLPRQDPFLTTSALVVGKSLEAETIPFDSVYSTEVWTRVSVTEFDKAARAVLIGTDPKVVKDQHGKPAAVQVLLLLKPAETGLKPAVAAARAYLTEQLRRTDKEAPEPTLVKNRTGADQAEDRTINEIMGIVLKLRAVGADKRERYYVLWIVPTEGCAPGRTVRLRRARRDFWEAEFRELIESALPKN